MRIDAANYETLLTAVGSNFYNQQLPPMPADVTDSDRDSYIPSIQKAGMEDYAIPSGTYGTNGMMIGDMPLLSNAFRANKDSILSTMETLGLTMDDLSDEENLKTLVTAMNEGAANLGLQTTSVDETISMIVSAMEGGNQATSDNAGVLGAEGVESTGNFSGSGGSGGAGSDSEISTQYVTINGMVYLETTITENGQETVTRSLVGAAEEV